MPKIERKNSIIELPTIEPRKSTSLLGRPVKWLRGDEDRKSVFVFKRALAGITATLLAISLIGIIPLVFAVKKWIELKPRPHDPVTSLQVSHIQSNFSKTEEQSSHSESESKKTSELPEEEILAHQQKLLDGNNPPEQPSPVQNLAIQEIPLLRLEDCQFAEAPKEKVLAFQDKLRQVNKKYDQINLNSLDESGRLPTHKLEVEGVTYYCSNPFSDGRNIYSFALVEFEGKVYPRVFYLSGSQGTWRVAPYAEKRILFTGNRGIAKLGKGLAENDTQLPIPIGLALHALPLPEVPGEIGKITDLMQTVKPMEVSPKYKKGVNLQEFLSQAPISKGFQEEGYLIPFTDTPEEIPLPSEQNLPDFTKTFEMEVNLQFYGKCTAKYMPSINGMNYYLFYENEGGYAYLASLEKVRDNPIGKFGVRKTAWEMHHLDAPLLEYSMQIPRRFKTWKNLAFKQQKYWNNWNYVREIPLIKLYYEKTGRDLPEPFESAYPNG